MPPTGGSALVSMQPPLRAQLQQQQQQQHQALQ